MRRIRGFKLKKRIQRISIWILRRTRIRYNRLNSIKPVCKQRAITRFINWGRRVTSESFKLLKCKKTGLNSGYLPIGEDPVQDKPDPVPKGHSAVYVGKKDGDFHRVLVPIVYLNHPLFGELLREAEEEYGFNQQGGITIPCPYSDFQKIQTRIKSGSDYRKSSWIRCWQ